MRRQQHGDYSSIRVEISGTARRKFITLIFKMASGGYAGNGFGESGAHAILLEVRHVEPVIV